MRFALSKYVLAVFTASFLTIFFLCSQVWAATLTIDNRTAALGSCGGTLTGNWAYIGDNDDYEGKGTTLTHATTTFEYLNSVAWTDRAGGSSGFFPCAGCTYYARICSTDYPLLDHDLETGAYAWGNVRTCTAPGFRLEREALFTAPAIAFATSSKTWDLTASGESVDLRGRYPFIVFYQTDLSGDHVVSIQNWECTSAGDPLQEGGLIEYHSASGGYNLHLQREMRLGLVGSGMPIGFEEIDIVDLPDWSGDVQVGADTFYFPDRIECKLGEECSIDIRYRYADIGAMVYLYPDTATSAAGFVDSIGPLTDQYLLREELHPTVRETATVDSYKYLVRQGLTDLIVGPTVVYWVATTSLESEDADGILERTWSVFKRGFPFSLYFDIYDNLKAESVATSTRPEVINLNDLMVDPNWTASGTLLSADLIGDNLPIWNTLIYPLMEMLVHLAAFGFTISFMLWRRDSTV